MSRSSLHALLLVLALGPLPVVAYEGQTHQRLTFLAAKQFNRCVAETGIAPVTPLQVRYMARSNAALAEGNLFSRMFRWRYYDRAEEAERSALWVIDTRFHEHFNELKRRLESARNEVDLYRQLGRVISYLQLVTSPPHVVPVYTGRFWRFSFADRFDSFPWTTRSWKPRWVTTAPFSRRRPSVSTTS